MQGLVVAVVYALAVLIAPVAAHAQYGAVAYNFTDGGGGIALNQPTEEAARARAMSTCRGPACAIQQIVQPGQCLAVCMGATLFAPEQSTETFQWGVGDTRQEAIGRARLQCRAMFPGSESRGERVGCNQRTAAPARVR